MAAFGACRSSAEVPRVWTKGPTISTDGGLELAAARYVANLYPARPFGSIDEAVDEYESLDLFHTCNGSCLPYVPEGAFYAYEASTDETSPSPIRLAMRGAALSFASGITMRSGPQPSWSSPELLLRYVLYPNGICPHGHSAQGQQISGRFVSRSVPFESDRAWVGTTHACTHFDLRHAAVLRLMSIRPGSFVEVQQYGGWRRQRGDLWVNLWRGSGVAMRLANPLVALSKLNAIIDLLERLSHRGAETIARFIDGLGEARRLERKHGVSLQLALAYHLILRCPCCQTSLDAIVDPGSQAAPLIQRWLSHIRGLEPESGVAAFRALPFPTNTSLFNGGERFSIYYTLSSCGIGDVTRGPSNDTEIQGVNELIATMACMSNTSAVVLAASPNDNGLLHQEAVDYEVLLDRSRRLLADGTTLDSAVACVQAMKSPTSRASKSEQDTFRRQMWMHAMSTGKFATSPTGAGRCLLAWGSGVHSHPWGNDVECDNIHDPVGNCWLHCGHSTLTSSMLTFPEPRAFRDALLPAPLPHRDGIQTGRNHSSAKGSYVRSWCVREAPFLRPHWPQSIVHVSGSTHLPRSVSYPQTASTPQRGEIVSARTNRGLFVTDGWRYFKALACGNGKSEQICLMFKDVLNEEHWAGALTSRDGLHFEGVLANGSTDARAPVLIMPGNGMLPAMVHNLEVVRLPSGYVAVGGKDTRLQESDDSDETGVWMIRGSTWSYSSDRLPVTSVGGLNQKRMSRLIKRDTTRNVPVEPGATQWRDARTIIDGMHPACFEGSRIQTPRLRLKANVSKMPCNFDGRLSMAVVGSRWLLFARANLARGVRFVQVTASDDHGKSWGPFRLISLDSYGAMDGNVYFFSVQTNPVHPGSLLAVFPLSQAGCGCIAMAASRDGVHWSQPTPLRPSPIDVLDMGHRTRDHPVAGMVRAVPDGATVWFYVHENVPKNIERTSIELQFNETALREAPSRIVRHEIPADALHGWTQRQLVRLGRRRGDGDR